MSWSPAMTGSSRPIWRRWASTSKDTAIPDKLERSGVLDGSEALRLTPEHLKQQIPKPELRG